MNCPGPLRSSAHAESQTFQAALRGIAATCLTPQVCKGVFTGVGVRGRGCRSKCTVGTAPSPPGPCAGGCGAGMDGRGGSAQPRYSTGGRRRAKSGKSHGAELSTQTTMHHLRTSLQRVGALRGCSWEASPPAERGRKEGGRKHHLLLQKEGGRKEKASPPPLSCGLWLSTDAV